MKLTINDLDVCYNKSNLKWLKTNTIYLTLHGSHAYGTARPDSDIDVRGICIPPIKQYNLGILDKFEQAEFKEPIDCVIFDLKKFVKLAIENNPNALEILFTEPEDHIFVSDIGKKLLDIRDLFLSKKIKYTMSGYAAAQIKRIERHRKWILKPFSKKPERSDFELPENQKLIPEHQLLEIEAAVQKRLEEWNPDTTGMDNAASIKFKNELYDILVEMRINHDDMHIYAARSLGLNDNLLEAFKKERAYKNALREYKAYEVWQKERNRERYELEVKWGYDLKHGSHLVRLYSQAIDCFNTGKLVVKRSNVEEILAVKKGAWTYEQLLEWAAKQEEILNELYKTSNKLPREPARTKINDWLMDTLTDNILDKE